MLCLNYFNPSRGVDFASLYQRYSNIAAKVIKKYGKTPDWTHFLAYLPMPIAMSFGSDTSEMCRADLQRVIR